MSMQQTNLRLTEGYPRVQCIVILTHWLEGFRSCLGSETSLTFCPPALLSFLVFPLRKQQGHRLSLKLHYLPKDKLSDKRNTVVSSLLPGNLTSREEWLSQQRRLKIDTMPRCQLNFVTGFNLFFWKSTYLFKKWFTVPKLSTSSLVSPLWRGPINISVFLGILILLCCLGSSPYICPPFLLACLLLAYFINSIIRTLENRKKGIFFSTSTEQVANPWVL